MRKSDKFPKSKAEKTLFTSFLISMPAPFFTGFAYYLSRSTTQLADFFRRTAELGAIIISWIVYKTIHSNEKISEERKVSLERLSNIGLTCSMIFSGLVMIMLSTFKFSNYEIMSQVGFGVFVSSCGLLTNVLLYIRYVSLNKNNYNSVIAGHVKLYLSKILVDLCVFIALLTILIIPHHAITRYIDTFASSIVAVYLIWNGIRIYNGKSEINEV